MIRIKKALLNLEASLVTGGATPVQAKIDSDTLRNEIFSNESEVYKHLRISSDPLKAVITGSSLSFLNADSKINFNNDLT